LAPTQHLHSKLNDASTVAVGPRVQAPADWEPNRVWFEEEARKDERWIIAHPDFKWHQAKGELIAHVSAGRWVADCPECNGGCLLLFGTQDTACYDCGAIYSRVHWPEEDEIQKAEMTLSLRPPENQNWHPNSEPREILRMENKAHDLPPGPK
jgi:hypothetical protein